MAIPDQLARPLMPLIEAGTFEAIPQTFLYNMQSCGICYSRYRALVEAIEARKDD